MATLGLSEAEKAAAERLEKMVVAPSMEKLIVLQFTATWCGPCKQLTPILDKIAADFADKGVALVRIDVDEDKLIAAQFRIQSVPTIYAVFQGQPVADLTNYRTEGQLKTALDQLVAQLPIKSEAQSLQAEIAPLLAMAEEVLAEGDATRAVGMLSQIYETASGDPEVIGTLARAYIAAGEVEAARTLLGTQGDDSAKHPAIGRAMAALDLASAPAADTAADEARLAADPDDHEARFAIANAAMASGDRDRAADELLEIVCRDSAWNDGAARARLLQILEAVGFEDPWGRGIRRRLSALLFT
ncbi:MAG: tetratricopeptide repeat protein [Sphingomicrobium sp.]